MNPAIGLDMGGCSESSGDLGTLGKWRREDVVGRRPVLISDGHSTETDRLSRGFRTICR